MDAAVAAEEAAHMGLGMLVLANELSALERAWMAEKGAAYSNSRKQYNSNCYHSICYDCSWEYFTRFHD